MSKDKEMNLKKESRDRCPFDKNNDRAKMRRKNHKKYLSESEERKSSTSNVPQPSKDHRSPMKRNLAQSRLKRLRTKLQADIKMKEKLENVETKHLINKSVVKVDKSVAQKLKQYKIPKSDAQVSTSSAKNIAGARLEKLKQQLQTITEPKVVSEDRSDTSAKDPSDDKDMLMEVDVDMSEIEDNPALSLKESPLINKKISPCENFIISNDSETVNHDVSFINDEILKIREEPCYIALHTNFVSDVEMNLAVPVGDLFIVVDTNVFLSHLKFLDYLVKHSIPPFTSHVLVVPWPVIQEIDYAMKKNNQRLALQARYANNFINDCLKKKDTRFFGQSLADFKENFKNAVNIDDFILQYCMKFASLDNNVVLLTEDKNLCSKAMINQLTVHNKEEFQKAFNISGYFK